MKEPSLLRKIVEIHWEQAKRRRALRQLAKSEWTWEYLEAVITHAADMLRKGIEVEVTSPQGHKLKISSVKNRNSGLNTDNDIFNHLDDEAAVQRFIADHAPRR
jgi:leucyl aminopeptidase (aminopeptidase T)